MDQQEKLIKRFGKSIKDKLILYIYIMNKLNSVLQIGSHIGNTPNDPIYNLIDESTRLILVEPVPYLFEQLK